MAQMGRCHSPIRTQAGAQISRDRYREWKLGQSHDESPLGEVDEPEEAEEDHISPQLIFEESEGRAREEIVRVILNRGPCEFPDMVAALLRAM